MKKPVSLIVLLFCFLTLDRTAWNAGYEAFSLALAPCLEPSLSITFAGQFFWPDDV